MLHITQKQVLWLKSQSFECLSRSGQIITQRFWNLRNRCVVKENLGIFRHASKIYNWLITKHVFIAPSVLNNRSICIMRNAKFFTKSNNTAGKTKITSLLPPFENLLCTNASLMFSLIGIGLHHRLNILLIYQVYGLHSPTLLVFRVAHQIKYRLLGSNLIHDIHKYLNNK